MTLTFPLQGSSGPCPHCGVAVSFCATQTLGERVHFKDFEATDRIAIWARPERSDPAQIYADSARCPNCDRSVVMLHTTDPEKTWFAWPEGIARKPLPMCVPAELVQDYREAALVLSLSPKASAALSRRCLQALLRLQGYEQHSLADQIATVLPDLPKYLRAGVDEIRVLGNFAAHPMKSTTTGMILDVTDGEADWMLEVLELLFDHFYARPEEYRSKRAALSDKLRDAGKKPLP